MREDISRHLLEIARTNADALRDAAALLTASYGEPLATGRTRDSLSSILRGVRSGDIQAIGAEPDEMVLLISLEDLMTLLHKASRPKSFADALAELGFEPVGNHIEIPSEPGGPGPTLYGVAPHETA